MIGTILNGPFELTGSKLFCCVKSLQTKNSNKKSNCVNIEFYLLSVS